LGEIHNYALESLALISVVVLDVVLVMKNKENSYSLNQIRGLEIGLEMIIKGDELFNRLAKENQQELFYLVTEIEKDMLGVN
jgi:hypothetical protein